ncbi:hypothetical protein MLD38_023316 [Melastoma candidum]|uniref:Uncharacterized protein n=1 Tax=Melastoma candidum TaxID=119954 RepID=A0ACB9QQL1_9MYRT|nr:hypothetical protein MLD38_023316 [Melastoma candidum]
MGSVQLVHVFMVSFPGQGHVNPLLRLAKRVAARGLLVTFLTPESTGRLMRKANPGIGGEPTPVGDGFVRFEFIDDGIPDNDPLRDDIDLYIPILEKAGKAQIPEMARRHAEQGRPVACLVNNPFIPWVTDVAESMGIPSAVLWVQSCACFSAYYHYYHELEAFPTESDREVVVKLPGMPPLRADEIPSFLCPWTPYPFLRRAILGQFRNLEKPFCVLMDTFEELEHDVLEHVSTFCPVKTVGPLFKNPGKSKDGGVSGDFVKVDNECIGWLDSKAPRSAVYISFGSVVYLKPEQFEELAYGLLDSGLNFLWVLKPPKLDPRIVPWSIPPGFLEAAGERAKVVQWCPQERVLEHPSTACFVTHCGWNSTMEALSSGMPVVTYPQWGDQVTDAKYLVDVFGVGVSLSRGEEEEKLITRDVVKERLLEATTGPSAEEIRRNALKWKEAADVAVDEGGSSDRNVQEFVDEIKRISGGVIKGVGTVA